MTYLLHNVVTDPTKKVNSNYNLREEVENSEGLLTFDGIYRNVYQNREMLEGRDVILFVMGDYVGGDNTFDKGMPYETYCDWNEIMEMVEEYGCELGWHTWSHRDLSKLSYDEIVEEVTPPFPMKHFGYPYGRFNQEVVKAVVEAGFDTGWSVVEGDDTEYQKLRKYL